jgi:hypothetical protein
MVRVRIW